MLAATEFHLTAMSTEILPLSLEALASMGLRGIHCGSGRTLHAELLNMDAMQIKAGEQCSQPGKITCFGGRYYYLQHDQTTLLPLQDSSVDWVFSEHFIEHIQPSQAIAWLAELYRVMRPGGIARISTPDLGLYVSGYADPEQKFYDIHRERLAGMGMKNLPTSKAWMLNQIFRFYGHQWLYDYQELASFAGQAGFAPEAIQRHVFASGMVPELARLDKAARNDESVYIELYR